jgi:hypothetical protein
MLASIPQTDRPTPFRPVSLLGIAAQSAHAALVRLEAAGILSERAFPRRRKGRPRRMLAATELIDLIA